LDKFACIFDPLNYKSTDDVVIGPKAADFSANSGTQADNPHKVNLGSITSQIQTPGGTGGIGYSFVISNTCRVSIVSDTS
jgi:hypothetical protein